jgi:hypothetical protein
MEVIKTNLFTIATDIQYFLVTGLKTLPLTIGGTLLIIGLTVANYSMLFFLVGYLIIVPIIAFFFNLLMSLIKNDDNPDWLKSIWPILYSGKDKNVCNVVGGIDGITKSNEFDNTVSYWVAMTGFLLGYLITNATKLYGKDTLYNSAIGDLPLAAVDPDSTTEQQAKEIAAAKDRADAGASNRKSQTLMAIIILSILICIIVYMRIWDGCDGFLSLIVGGLFGLIGYGWYERLAYVGDDRLSDLFGIANRLMIPEAMLNAPYACLPQAGN